MNIILPPWLSVCPDTISVVLLGLLVSLQAMGWSEGQGLGRSNQGIVEPVKVRSLFNITVLHYDMYVYDIQVL